MRICKIFFFFHFQTHEDGGAEQQPSTLTNQYAMCSSSTSIHPSSLSKPMNLSQPSTSKTTFDATTNNTTTHSSSSTEPGTSTGFQKLTARGMTYKLICETVNGV